MKEKKELERTRMMMREKKKERKEKEMGWERRNWGKGKVEEREERAEGVKKGRKWKRVERIVVGRKERGRREGKKERR